MEAEKCTFFPAQKCGVLGTNVYVISARCVAMEIWRMREQCVPGPLRGIHTGIFRSVVQYARDQTCAGAYCCIVERCTCTYSYIVRTLQYIACYKTKTLSLVCSGLNFLSRSGDSPVSEICKRTAPDLSIKGLEFLYP